MGRGLYVPKEHEPEGYASSANGVIGSAAAKESREW